MDKPIVYFDKRIVDRSVRKGLLRAADLTRYHDELLDASDKAEVVSPEDLEEEQRVRPAAAPAPSEPSGPEAAEAGAPVEWEAPGGEEAAPSGAAGEEMSGEPGPDPSGEEGGDPPGGEGMDPSGQQV
jgi:hypothetical protein